MDGKQSVAVAFFGEGALDEGSVYESFNFASVRKLPVLYVCENNIYATESPLSVRQAAGTDLCDRVRSFKIEARHIDGNDILAVLDAAKSAVGQCRSGRGPFFLECDTYRWREHVGPLWDDEAKRTYRTKQEVEAWMQKCPIKRFGAHLLGAKLATPEQLEAWRAAIDNEIQEALEAGKASSWPQASSLFENIV
jgi:pyruvate dehydrogenase E1 component alpha subunit